MASELNASTTSTSNARAGSFVERDARVAEHDPCARGTVRQVRELPRIAGEIGNRRIDLEERPLLARLAVRRKRPDAEADDANAAFVVSSVESREELPDRPGPVKVSRRLAALVGIEMLDAVNDATVNQVAEVPLGQIEHAVHAEETAPAMTRMFLRGSIRAAREHECPDSQREAQGTSVKS